MLRDTKTCSGSQQSKTQQPASLYQERGSLLGFFAFFLFRPKTTPHSSSVVWPQNDKNRRFPNFTAADPEHHPPPRESKDVRAEPRRTPFILAPWSEKWTARRPPEGAAKSVCLILSVRHGPRCPAQPAAPSPRGPHHPHRDTQPHHRWLGVAVFTHFRPNHPPHDPSQ